MIDPIECLDHLSCYIDRMAYLVESRPVALCAVIFIGLVAACAKVIETKRRKRADGAG